MLEQTVQCCELTDYVYKGDLLYCFCRQWSVLSYKRRGKSRKQPGTPGRVRVEFALTLFICSHSPLKGR